MHLFQHNLPAAAVHCCLSSLVSDGEEYLQLVQVAVDSRVFYLSY